MREKQVLRKVEKALSAVRRGDLKETVSILLELKHRLEQEIEKKEKKKDYGDKLRHLMGWYLKLWDDKPPEALKFMEPKAIIGKHLKELIAIYERNGETIDDLKRDYEEFLRTWKRGNKGLLHFRNALPTFKKQPGKWTDEENTRGINYYLKALEEEEETPWDEGDELPDWR